MHSITQQLITFGLDTLLYASMEDSKRKEEKMSQLLIDHAPASAIDEMLLKIAEAEGKQFGIKQCIQLFNEIIAKQPKKD